MKKTFALICVFVLLCVSLCSCGLVKSPDKYELGDDSVPSITKVVGDREVKTMQTGKQYVMYSYKNVKDSKADVEQYASYLVNTEKFTADKRYKNLEASGELTFTKSSPSDSNYFITVKVKFSEGEYKIEADRSSRIA